MTTDELKSAIQAAVYENSTGAITGTALQNILLTMVDNLAPINLPANSPGTNVTGTLAECAAAAGISETEFLRLCRGETAFISIPSPIDHTIYLRPGLGWFEFTGGPMAIREMNDDMSTNKVYRFYNLGNNSFRFTVANS